jgi:hypothetical protein
MVWPYSDESIKLILDMISKFDANFGGTEILEPLKNALMLDVGGRKKRVFLLTDGEA